MCVIKTKVIINCLALPQKSKMNYISAYGQTVIGTSEKLYPYLADIEEQAEAMFSQLVKSLTEKENVTEKLKANNPMLWVLKMNNIRNRAMEIVNSEVIFV